MTGHVLRIGRAAALVVVLVASAARSEVRLVVHEHGPKLAVVSAARGPWSPVGQVDPLVLNPDGDATGDSRPVWAVAGRSVLAGWTSGDNLELAVGSSRWDYTGSVGLGETAVKLAVVPVGELWCVVWVPATTPDVTRLLAITGSGVRSEVLTLEAGTLLEADAVGTNALRTVTVTASGQLWSTTIVVFKTPQADPILVPAVQMPVAADWLSLAPPGEPFPLPLEAGWALLWHEGTAPTVIRAKTVAADGRLGAPIDLAEGRIVATLPQAGDRTHVIAVQPDGQLTDFVLTFSLPAAPEPIDGPAVTSVNDIEFITNAARADVRLHQLASTAVLTWWAGPRELRAVELGTDGPVYPIRSFESRGATTYQPVLLRRALDAFSSQ